MRLYETHFLMTGVVFVVKPNSDYFKHVKFCTDLKFLIVMIFYAFVIELSS